MISRDRVKEIKRILKDNTEHINANILLERKDRHIGGVLYIWGRKELYYYIKVEPNGQGKMIYLQFCQKISF